MSWGAVSPVKSGSTLEHEGPGSSSGEVLVGSSSCTVHCWGGLNWWWIGMFNRCWAEGILGLTVVCLHFELRSSVLVKQKYRSVRWSFCSLHTVGTAKVIGCYVPISQPHKQRYRLLQHECGAQLLSWSANIQPKYNLYTFFTIWLKNFAHDFGVNSAQT